MTNAINSQPQVSGTSYSIASPGSSDWSSKTCGCFDDIGICLCGMIFPLCLCIKVALDHEESCCVPFLPGAMVALRTSMRSRYQINGSVCGDWKVMACCFMCGLCQLAREQKMRR